MLDKNAHSYIIILKNGLSETVEKIEYDIDVNKFIEVSINQKNIPLLVEGLYRSGIYNEDFAKAKRYAIQQVYLDALMESKIKKIKDLFEEKKIDYALLKGASLKNIYPKSSLRLMSDIDILIKEEQYQKIRECMISLGFVEVRESDHELIWKDGPVIVELHKRLIPTYNDDYYEYYKNHWEKFFSKETVKCEYVMKPEDEYIYLFIHMTKHYRDGGGNLRNIIDLWLYKEKNNLDLEYIKNELIKIKLDKFYENIISTIDVWFNGKESSEITELITKRLIGYGSLNTKELMDAANAARQSARTSTVKEAKNKNYIRLIFMPYSNMCVRYPFLRTLPILLPIMWLVRWIDAVINRRDNMSRHYEKLNKIKQDVVLNYNTELETVGLRYRLKKDARKKKEKI